ARAAVADAHAASAPRPEPGALGLHQQRDAALATDVLEGPRETQGDLGAVGSGHHPRCEGLAARELGIAALSPEGVRGIEQATRAARQRATFGRVRRDAVEDGVAHGWQSRLRRWPADSFFPALLLRGGDAGGRRKRSKME